MKKLDFLKILVIATETGRVTRKYPYEPPLVSNEFRGKIEIDEKKCIGCGACVIACPPNALELKIEKNILILKYFVGRCIFCWRCVDVCPVKAIRGTSDFELATDNISDLNEAVIHDRNECIECRGNYSTVKQKQYVIEKSPITENYVSKCPDCRRNGFINSIQRRKGGVYAE
uniref:4Fe-4S dicluster domain-containing protein n=1 Tax=Staphylothermus marinus TaxID=2280 RepID=A0A7C4D731_STAMA